MSYVKTTDFAAKDALISGNPSKVIRGSEIGAEFDALQVADALNLKPSAPGTAGQILTSTGATAPAWGGISGGTF